VASPGVPGAAAAESAPHRRRRIERSRMDRVISGDSFGEFGG
jgi:hypothetical protein